MKKRTGRLKKSPKQEGVTLRTLIDNLPDGIFLKDNESRFVFANQVIAELMGAPDPSALTGKTDHPHQEEHTAIGRSLTVRSPGFAWTTRSMELTTVAAVPISPLIPP